MTHAIFVNGKAISLGGIDCENDLKPIPGYMSINPPPSDGKCDCCGKHISELKPFGKAGDPLVGDFDGEVLIKKFRLSGPYDENAEKAVGEALAFLKDSGCEDADPLPLMIEKYGKTKAERYYYTSMSFNQIESSWECRDCVCLDYNEYWDKVYERCNEQSLEER